MDPIFFLLRSNFQNCSGVVSPPTFTWKNRVQLLPIGKENRATQKGWRPPSPRPLARLPVALFAAAMSTGGAAQPVVAPGQCQGPVAGRRWPRALPRRRARQHPPFPPVGSPLLPSFSAFQTGVYREFRDLSDDALARAVSASCGDGFGGARGHARDPRQGQQQAVAQGGR
jgi:hypothetical protein